MNTKMKINRYLNKIITLISFMNRDDWLSNFFLNIVLTALTTSGLAFKVAF